MSLILIMGLPAAGKSTLAAKLLDYHPNSVLFSLDDINGRWSSEFQAHVDRKSFEQTVRMYLEQNCDDEFNGWVIVDDNFYLQSMRRPFKRMARAFALQFYCILMECDVQDALLKNSNRGEDRVSEETVLKMAREMEVPEDAVVYKNQNLEEITKQLSKSRPKRAQRQITPPTQTSNSALSEVDRILRTVVSEAVQGGMDGRILSFAKKAVMDMCRHSRCAPDFDGIRELLVKEYLTIKSRATGELH
ncbi:unnamed protein product [Strongylus vulgaris]|uniref:L-seryl-tRNA(Sec) kinase n=1 Tax=Strongylus vulgaris TaxID=40348 RepID=A0A3P7IWG6_STRVU|nr:unnamed protein product [Strongylus vulgaris]